MNRVQQGHQQVLVGKDDGRLDVVSIFILLSHRLHQVKSLLGLSHIRRYSHNTHLGSRAVERQQLLGTKTLAVTID